MATLPLEPAKATPLVRAMLPPEESALSPAWTLTDAPMPPALCPAPMVMLPLLLADDEPVWSEIAPELPITDVPDERQTAPLHPVVPAFAEATQTTPLPTPEPDFT